MRTDIDYLIKLMKDYTFEDRKPVKDEMGEQEEGGSPTNTGRKWETGLTRGKANKLGLAGEKWETGLTRGHANPVP